MFKMQSLADNIKKYRRKNGIKQYELAQMLHVRPQSVSKWEQCLSIPDTENLCRLSEIFQISVDKLLDHQYAVANGLIAIDGGGTKTEFLLISEQGNIKRRIILDGCNPNICGLERTCEILKTGIESLRTLETTILAIYCGIAGALSGNNRESIKSFLKETYEDSITECNSDIFNISASVTSGKCITAICGTGSNVCAINGTELHRVGGWGYLFDGAGSGYDIGRDAICAALAQNDMIGPKTRITDLVEQRLGAGIWESINRLYMEDKAFIASFSNEVFAAYKSGDAVAKQIIEKNISALAEKINFAAKKYDCGNTVIVAGGIMNQREIVTEIFKKALDRHLELVIPDLPPVYGACVLCCGLLHIHNEGFKETFTADYAKFTKGGA